MRKCNNKTCPNKHQCQRYDAKTFKSEVIKLRTSDVIESGIFCCQFYTPVKK